jgi:hypothetical protein
MTNFDFLKINFFLGLSPEVRWSPESFEDVEMILGSLKLTISLLLTTLSVKNIVNNI